MAESVRARFYTVQEARAALPRVKALMALAQTARAEILALRPRVWPFLRSKIANGGNADITDLTEQFARLDAALRQIMGMGVLVKDVDKGIVDFLAMRKGQRVFLCWRYGEESIEHWHPIDSGFAGRKPLIESDFDDSYDDGISQQD